MIKFLWDVITFIPRTIIKITLLRGLKQDGHDMGWGDVKVSNLK